MPLKPLFEGLIVDELGQPVTSGTIGDEPCYIIHDGDFLRHIPSQQVDRQVLEIMRNQISGNEDLLSEQAAKMLGTEDIFSKAMLNSQLKNIDQQFETLFQTGIPDEARSFMGMSGFKVIIDYHGNVVKLNQPAGPEGEGENE